MDNKYKVLADCQWQSIQVRRDSLNLVGPEVLYSMKNRQESPPSDFLDKFLVGFKKFSKLFAAGSMLVASVSQAIENIEKGKN